LEESGYRSPTWAVIRPFELTGKEIFFKYAETTSKEEKQKEREQNHIAGRVYDTGHGGSKATSKWQ